MDTYARFVMEELHWWELDLVMGNREKRTLVA